MSSKIQPVSITAYTATTACGVGRSALLQALTNRQTGLRPNDFGPSPLPTYIGRVQGLEEQALPEAWSVHECRNNRLAWLGLNADNFLEQAKAAVARYGADRVGLLLATSTASIGASEEAYSRLTEDKRFPEDLRRSTVHHPHSLGDFLGRVLGTRGPCLTTATACSSSAKVFAQAERLLRLGVIDAAIVGGVDTLCGSVLFGFNALELVSPEPCRPCDPARRGINLGEAAGFALLERDGAPDAPRLLGWGESSDAHHMSTPHPEGLGARLAIEAALARAGLSADQVDYINMHGTASQKNDEVEAGLIARMFPATTRASSTKGWMGHTLGAAGIVEAVICLLALEAGLAPGCLNSQSLDPVCGPQIRLDNEHAPLRIALSNSFGFGGNNASLVFQRGQV
ncbi:beta-ketoacyl-[acyl-carrier-protein] synthase family protein [Ahniella affigens]|uniref:beta-ketoacyl-[acyl-carrier-protein] synthase family protein n=1 Tax=Ahniella affigens TaxID=2021234 RepID=UPI001F0B993D|nr:beta-ketoacyl-[acyl-carrier-protein] synthase family protein [Ahniella affigens]